MSHDHQCNLTFFENTHNFNIHHGRFTAVAGNSYTGSHPCEISAGQEVSSATKVAFFSGSSGFEVYGGEFVAIGGNQIVDLRPCSAPGCDDMTFEHGYTSEYFINVPNCMHNKEDDDSLKQDLSIRSEGHRDHAPYVRLASWCSRAARNLRMLAGQLMSVFATSLARLTSFYSDEVKNIGFHVSSLYMMF